VLWRWQMLNFEISLMNQTLSSGWRLSIGDYKCPLWGGTYNLQSINASLAWPDRYFFFLCGVGKSSLVNQTLSSSLGWADHYFSFCVGVGKIRSGIPYGFWRGKFLTNGHLENFDKKYFDKFHNVNTHIY